MHFKNRDKFIQCVRTAYDADQKKIKTQVVGVISRSTLDVSDEFRLSLKPQELAEVYAHISNLKRLKELELEFSARTIVRQMDLVVQWLEVAISSTENEVLAKEILRNEKNLRKALIGRFGKLLNVDTAVNEIIGDDHPIMSDRREKMEARSRRSNRTSS